MRIKFIAQENNGILRCGSNIRLTGILELRVRRIKHIMLLLLWPILLNIILPLKFLDLHIWEFVVISFSFLLILGY